MKNSINKVTKIAGFGLLAVVVLLTSGCTDNPSQSAALTSDTGAIQAEGNSTNDEKISQYLSALVDNHIVPSYQQLNSSVEQLNTTVSDACSVESPTSPEWQELQSSWRDVMADWQQIQWLKLGPVSELNVHSRIQYWPDANGAAKRGVSKLLLSAETPSLETLSNQNVGAQGLPALEYMLFSDELAAQFDSAKRCESITIVAANIQQMTKTILDVWQVESDGYATDFVSGKGEFTGVKDTLEELTSNWLAQLILIVDNKLTYPLSISAPGVPQLAESPIADSSGDNIVQNLLSFRAIYTANGDASNIGFNGLLRARTSGDRLSSRILDNIDKSIQIAETLRPSFTASLASKHGRASIEALIKSLRTLQQLLAVDMLDTLTLNTGFNSLDGD